MNKSESIAALTAALAKAQGEIAGAKKDETNPFYKSKYADLASVWEACRAPLSRNQLAVIQTTGFSGEGQLSLFTTLSHASGEWITGEYPLVPVKDDPQGMGSCVSYARRYCLAAMAGVFQVDDDGNEASRSNRAIIAKNDQPPMSDGSLYDDGIYRFPGGSHHNKKVTELSVTEHREYITKSEAWHKKQGRPLPAWWPEYLKIIEPLIAAHEKATQLGDFSNFDPSTISGVIKK